jgi:hypothetical protein
LHAGVRAARVAAAPAEPVLLTCPPFADPAGREEAAGAARPTRPAPARIGLSGSNKEARMALARVVSFEGVGKDRIEQMDREMRESEPPEGMPVTEVIVLHDSEAEKSLVILFFDSEDDYRRGDEVLSAMPADDTPGRRTSVAKYDVAIRMAR